MRRLVIPVIVLALRRHVAHSPCQRPNRAPMLSRCTGHHPLHRGALPLDRVVSDLAHEFTAMPEQVADQVATLHLRGNRHD